MRIQLHDTGLNSFAIGAKVMVETASGKKQFEEMYPTRGFQSSIDPILHFGLGTDSAIKKVVIRWPDSKVSSYVDIKINSTITLKPGLHLFETVSVSTPPPPLFSDITTDAGIRFVQHENKYVDFKHEYLLPWQLSKQGPLMAKADVNKDGLEDIFIGAPMGQAAQLYFQTKDEKFILSPSQPWVADSMCEDIQSTFFDADGDGDPDLFVVSGGNEPHAFAIEMQDRLYLNNGNGNFSKKIDALPKIAASKSCVAIADYNKDGKPDIFVGGRIVPGKYGAIPESYLLRNVSSTNSVRFENVIDEDAKDLKFAGMVTDADWIDINKDGWDDLIVVGEWMPVKILINSKGRLLEKSSDYGLIKTGGLWTRIIPGDLDGDGDVDLLLGNLAPNTQLRASANEPMTLCVNDFMHNGRSIPVICYYLQGTNYPYASLDELVEQMPVLKKKFLRYANYATATLKDIFTPEQLKGMKEYYVHTVKNCWLQNQGNGKFILKELPVMAQFSAIQGAVTGDFNRDGKNEIFAAGNFYPFRVQLGREDAGKGFMLQNDKENFVAKGTGLTGVTVDGDVRDMIVVKSEKNKEVIIVSKNNSAVQVLKTNR